MNEVFIGTGIIPQFYKLANPVLMDETILDVHLRESTDMQEHSTRNVNSTE